MNPALPKTLCKAIDMLGHGIKRKNGLNLAKLKSKLGITKKGRAG